VKKLLSPAVNRGDQRRLNYNKTAFLAEALSWTLLGKLMTLSQTPESDEEGILSPHYPVLSPRDPRALRFPSKLVPHFLDQSYAPDLESPHIHILDGLLILSIDLVLFFLI